jgi:hypothetical protein
MIKPGNNERGNAWNPRTCHNDLLDRPLLGGRPGLGPVFEVDRVIQDVQRKWHTRCRAHAEIDPRLPVVDRPCRNEQCKPDKDEACDEPQPDFCFGGHGCDDSTQRTPVGRATRRRFAMPARRCARRAL